MLPGSYTDGGTRMAWFSPLGNSSILRGPPTRSTFSLSTLYRIVVLDLRKVRCSREASGEPECAKSG